MFFYHFVRSNPDQPRVGRRARVSVGLTNPLKEELTNCVFGIEAPGFVDSMKRRFRYDCTQYGS